MENINGNNKERSKPMITEYQIARDDCQRIATNPEKVETLNVTEWCKENDHQTIEIQIRGNDNDVLNYIFIDKDDFIRLARKIMAE